MYGYYFNGLNLEDTPQEPCISPENIFYNGLYYIRSSSYYGPDIYRSIRVRLHIVLLGTEVLNNINSPPLEMEGKFTPQQLNSECII